jgi:hypothetical protein
LNVRSVQFKAEVCQFEKFKNSIQLGFILNGRGWEKTLKQQARQGGAGSKVATSRLGPLLK